MADFPGKPHLLALRDRALVAGRSRRVRKWALGVALVLVVFGLLGVFAAPPVLRSQLQQRASAALGRQVTIARVHFNPYTLRLGLDGVRIAGRAGQPDLVDIDHAVVNASWTSLFRRAPVLDALTLDRPRIRIVRKADGSFNFSDILARLAARPAAPDAAPARYAFSNIRVHGGSIGFDDEPAHVQHHLDDIELGIPFIANLPRDTDIDVQPLLALRIDGSPLRITGQTRPFANDRASTVDFHFDQLDLPRYLGYVPVPLPVRIPKGLLSGNLRLHFVQTTATPELQLTGDLQADGLVLTGPGGQPIAAVQHANVALTDVQPLVSRYHFGAVALDGAEFDYTARPGGHSNLDSLTAAPAATTPSPPTDLAIAHLALRGGTFRYTDATGHGLPLTNFHGSISGLALRPAPAARLDLAASFAGGELDAKGTLDLAAGKFVAALQARQVGLAPLQAVAGMPLADHTADGKLALATRITLDWHQAFNVALANAHATISDFALHGSGTHQATPLAWQKLDVTLAGFDLAAHTTKVDTLSASGLALDVQRRANGRVDLLEMLAGEPARGAPSKPGAPWHWSIAHLAFDHASVALLDHAAGPKPARIKLTDLAGSLDNLDDKLAAASALHLAGSAGRGSFTLAGTLRPTPLRADLTVDTRRLDLVPLAPYIGVPLNVTIARAALTSHGQLHYGERGRQPEITYRGNAALEAVRIQDKLTGDDFLRWRELAARNLDARIGSGSPRVHIGTLALRSFYARMIINANGRLNLSDVVANPAAAPISVTRANDGAASSAPSAATTVAAAPTPAPATTAAPAAANAAPAADVHIGAITLAAGQLNFTDNFIKPNYTANLMRLHGKIGAFGTAPGAAPAPIDIEAALNDSAPVVIGGTLNPLQPVATLNIQGSATGVELHQLSAYSTRYTGYPITGGKLTAKVDYRLDQRKLTADNHIFITELSFGPRDESPGIRHLPVKLAVALLKDPAGNIDINLPVSGSLDNPQFSVGGLVWHALVNLIGKAVTAPFRLLGAAFGGGHGDLDYVAFAPGSAVLDDAAQQRLTKIVALLDKKPALVLTITGRVDPATDVAGLRKVTVDNLVRRALLLDTQGKHADVSPAALAKVQVTPDQYEKYLKRAYRHDDIKGKPKGFLGLKKSPPAADMRRLMEAGVATDAKALTALGEARAEAVQAWLTGKLPPARIKLQAPKLDATGIDDKGPASRAQFGLHQD